MEFIDWTDTINRAWQAWPGTSVWPMSHWPVADEHLISVYLDLVPESLQQCSQPPCQCAQSSRLVIIRLLVIGERFGNFWVCGIWWGGKRWCKWWINRCEKNKRGWVEDRKRRTRESRRMSRRLRRMRMRMRSKERSLMIGITRLMMIKITN